jgi:golgi phosphoprotein 3
MTALDTPLYLHEEIMLLVLRDEQGTIEFGAWYNQALGSAVLSELLLAERIAIDDGKKHLVNLISDRPIGEPVIDECLAKIVSAKRRASATNWVSRFGTLKQLKHRVARGLCQRDILRADEDKVLLLFSRKIYPQVNPIPERELIDRMREAIFTDVESVDVRTAILVSLANACDVLKFPFDKKELKGRAKRIEQLSNGDLIGQAAKEAIQAIQAAIVVAAVMPAIISH